MSVFACADLHGRYDLFAQMRNTLEPNDTLYVIGDVFDRGPDGWKIYKEIKEDSRIILLCGNHEYMAERGLREWLTYGIGFEDWALWTQYNGGQVTFDTIFAKFNGKFSELNGLIQELEDLPTGVTYVNKDGLKLFLVHSGCTDFWKEDRVWDRRNLHHIRWRGKKNEIIVHGHTPIELMINDFKDNHIFADAIAAYEEDPGGAFWYCGNHKVCLDTGAVWTGYAVMLDLDTFDEHIFKGVKNG